MAFLRTCEGEVAVATLPIPWLIAFAIFRLSDNDNMIISNSNVLIGNGGITLNNVMFYTDQGENDTHFNFDNTIINGIAFWSLGLNGGTIDINNAQGCTQLVADIVDLDDVRFLRSAFAPVPCPWDCDGSNDAEVTILDLLALLAQWGLTGTSCDFDGNGVSPSDLLKLLANYKGCPD